MPPKKGESKQDFLGRCAREKRDAGLAEDKALAACAGEWNQARLAELVDDGRLRLGGTVDIQLAPQAAEGEQADPDRFAVLAYTGKLIDWGWLGRFIIDLKGMALAKAKVPCLLNHTYAIVGSIDKGSTDKAGFIVTGAFSQVATSKGPETLQHAREGFPWQASIGVQAVPGQIKTLAKGEKMTVNGQAVEGPCEVWLKSTVFEVSFVPFGADDDTAAIAMSKPDMTEGGKTISPEETNMPTPETPESKALAGQSTPAPAPAPDTAALEAAKAEGVKLATTQTAQDAAAMLAHAKTLGLSMDEIQPVMVLGLPKAKAAEKLLELAAAKNPPMGSGSFQQGEDEADKFRLAAGHGLRLRLGHKIDKPAPGHEEFRGLSLHELGRRCLERLGVNSRGLSPSQVASQVLRLSGAGSSSDFASITKDAVNMTLQRAYAEAPATWRPWCNVVSASNYKDIYGIALSEAPNLDLVGEGGEYKNGAFKDKQESYRLAKFGKIISLTEEMIVNDDTRAFTRLPQLLGAAASRKVAELVYGLLVSNPVMKEDGKRLFHADHKNLASGDAIGGVTSDILSLMRKAMRNQKGMKGAVLNIPPKYLLLPTGYETAAEILLRSVSLPEDGMSSGVVNPWAGKLIPITDAWLDADDEDAWYMTGDPNQVDTIEVAFLDGNEQPILTEDEEFRRDVLSWKVKQIVGVGAMDTRGLAKNPGASA